MSEPVREPTIPEQPRRRPYEAPKLAVVDLAAEEVLGGGCKVGGENAIGSSTCGFGGCVLPGS
jgi:hypothetical protein